MFVRALLALLVILCAENAQAAVAFVGSAINAAGCEQSTSTVTMTTTSGNALVMFVSYNLRFSGDTSSVTSVKDNNLVAFTHLTPDVTNDPYVRVEAWKMWPGTSATSFTVTMSWDTSSGSGTRQMGAVLGEYSGTDDVLWRASTTGTGTDYDLSATLASGNSFFVCGVTSPDNQWLAAECDTSLQSNENADSCGQSQGYCLSDKSGGGSTSITECDRGNVSKPFAMIGVEVLPAGFQTSTITATASVTNTITPTHTVSSTHTITPTPSISPTPNPDPVPCSQVWFSAETGILGGPQVIDAASNAIIGTPKGGTGIGGAGDNLGLWFTRNGLYVLACYYLNENLTRFSTQAPFAKATITNPIGNRNMTASYDSATAYFSNPLQAKIYVVNIASWTVSATISGTGIGGAGITINSAGTRLWNSYTSGIKVYDTSTYSVVATITTPAGGFDNTLLITPNGSFAYQTNNGINTLSVIDTSSYVIVATLTLENHPAGLAIAPNGSRVYASSLTGVQNAKIYTIDTTTNAVIATFQTDYQVHGIFTTADGSFLWVTDYGCGDGCENGRVVKYRASDFSVFANLDTGTTDASSSNSFAILHAPLCPEILGKINAAGRRRQRVLPR